MPRVHRPLPIRPARPNRPAPTRLPTVMKPRGLPPGNTAWLTGWCRNEDIFVIAGGPSLKGFDFSRLDGRIKIAVNRAAYFCEPDVMVFLDTQTTEEFRRKIPGFPNDIKTKIVCGHYAGLRAGGNVSVCQIGMQLSKELSPSGPMLSRLASALLGISIAIVGDARTIYLLGIDLDGGGYFHEGHPYAKLAETDKMRMLHSRQARAYDAIPRRYHERIVNLNPNSRLNTFRKMSPEEVLPCSQS